MISKMKNKIPDFELTSREISILCAFLDYNVLYGIETDYFTDWSENPRNKIVRTCEKMKQKNIFSHSIDGKIVISSKLYKCLKIIGEPDCFKRMRMFNNKGEKEEVYLYEKEGQGIWFEPSKIRNNKMYFVNDVSEFQSIIPDEMKQREMQSEKITIPLHLLQEARKKANNFELSEAERILKSQLCDCNEEIVQMIVESFQGKMPIIFSDLWKWKDGHQVTFESRCFVHWKDLRFELSIEDGEKLVLRR